jgi:sugar-specific transcriptional regulator TrmB
MRDNERNIGTLVDLGINRTQARIYLALIEKGTSTIRSVAEYSGVGRPDTYRAMLELKRAGLIETILSSPAKYKPIPIEDAVSFLMEHKQKVISALAEKSSKLLQEYQKKVLNEVDDYDSQFVLVPEGVTSIKRGIAAIRSAQSNINFIASFKRFNQIILATSEDIIEAANRGVKVRFILDKTNINGTIAKVFMDLSKTTSCKIKYVPKLTHSFIAVYDNKEIQMATSAEEDFIQAPILWSNNPVLVKVMQNCFDSVWFSQSSIWGTFEEEPQIQ